MQEKEDSTEEPDSNEPLTKKKPRSQKQIDAFKVAMEKRAINVAARKHDKLIVASEILVNNAKAPPATPAPTIKKSMKPIKEMKTPDNSSEDEEIIIVKSKPKKKVKKIIIESSESDTDSDGSNGGSAPQQISVMREATDYQRQKYNTINYFV